MKWDEEKIKKLTNLTKLGYRISEISKIMGLSYKTISNKMFRLKIKTIFKEKINCKNCNVEFEKYINNDVKFCSSSCSATFNNKKRKISEKTKNKISEKLKSKFDNIKLKKIRNCKICNTNNINKKYKTICDDCRYNYYKYYRIECNFKFNIKKYPEEFNLKIVNEHGWYSPKNKKNNLYGVSKDHKYSVMDGFKNKIDPKIISHPANCELLLFSNNSVKKDHSSITIDELLIRIKIWDEKYLDY